LFEKTKSIKTKNHSFGSDFFVSLPLPEREVRREWERLLPNPPLEEEEGIL